MSFESDLHTLLQGLCPRVFPDFADTSTQRPYVTYQGIGGRSLAYLDGTQADKRNSQIQINAWASTRAEALALIRSIELALIGSTAWQCKALAEPQWDNDEELGLRGCRQDFDIWAAR